MIRLGKFDKQGYKDSFSKGELARELVCMNNDYDKLEKENQKYKEVINRAVQLAYQYAQIDGGHHKMWVIDQMMRILLGSKYDNFVKEYEEDGEYEWNIGIAP